MIKPLKGHNYIPFCPEKKKKKDKFEESFFFFLLPQFFMPSIWYKIPLSICTQITEELPESSFYKGLFFSVGIHPNILSFLSILLEGR